MSVLVKEHLLVHLHYTKHHRAMKCEALPNTIGIQQVVKLRKRATEAPFAWERPVVLCGYFR